MDEVDMVRELYAQPPAPTRQEITDARARLAAPARPRRRARWALPGLGLVAAATAVTVVATQLGGAHRTTAPPAPVPMSARRVLLTAAESSARAQAAGGTYWFTEFRYGRTVIAQGHGERYLVEQRSDYKDWTNAHSPRRTHAQTKAGHGGTTTHFYARRPLGAGPVAAADVAAWRRAGSPSVFPVAGLPSARLNAGAGSWSVWRDETAFDSAFPDGSLERLRRLPADPVRLRAYFLGRKEGRQDWQTPDQWMFEAAASLLEGEPVPPAVRVAAYRMLAGLADVRATGAVTDPLGRRGVAVEMREGERAVIRLIIEPSTGRLLADERVAVKSPAPGRSGVYPPGTVLDWQALVDASWTDSPPKHAKVQPGG